LGSHVSLSEVLQFVVSIGA